MAAEIVTTTLGSEHALWLGNGDVLSFTLDRNSKSFPPVIKDCQPLNQTIQGLTRALKAVIFQADNDEKMDREFASQPIVDIADAILILSQLSEAVVYEATRDREPERDR
jgi:hypothetical protein